MRLHLSGNLSPGTMYVIWGLEIKLKVQAVVGAQFFCAYGERRERGETDEGNWWCRRGDECEGCGGIMVWLWFCEVTG